MAARIPAGRASCLGDDRSISRTGGILARIQRLEYREDADHGCESLGALSRSPLRLRWICRPGAWVPTIHCGCGSVPDVELARQKLCRNGFRENAGPRMTVTDRVTKVEVDLLPAGSKLDPGPLTFPVPTQVSDTPQILTLPGLISSKLSTYMGRGIERVRDELIQANRREYPVAPEVRDLYLRIWDELHP